MVPSLIILLFFLLTVHGSKYNIVSRRELEVSRAPSASPQLISFDGDLDYIIAQALARAGETSESPELSDSPSLSPSDVSTTSDSEDASVLNAFKCTNEAIGHLEILTFKYSIETALGANVSLVIGEVQEILLEAIAPSTLSCRNESNKFANIVAMDSSVPADTPSTEEKCWPELDPLHTCTVVDGRMRLFLTNRESATDAIALSLQEIRSALGQNSFVNRVETGLMKISFIQTDTSIDAPVTESSNEKSDLNQETRLSPTSSAFVAMGGAMIAAFVGAVYYLRQGRKEEVDAVAIQESGSSYAQTSPVDGDRPTSPFSEMLPGAYRMGDLDKMSILSNSNMSPVYEDSDGSRSVVVSESGYTTEAAGTDGGDDNSLTYTKRALYTPEIDNGYMSSTSQEYLGARPRDGAVPVTDLDFSDSEFDSTSEASSQASPRRLYSSSLLLPAGHQDESIHAEDILLFENEKRDTGVSTEQSMVDISLSEP